MSAGEHGRAQGGVEGVGEQPKTVNIAISSARERASRSPCSRRPTSGLAFTSRGVGWLVAMVAWLFVERILRILRIWQGTLQQRAARPGDHFLIRKVQQCPYAYNHCMQSRLIKLIENSVKC